MLLFYITDYLIIFHLGAFNKFFHVKFLCFRVDVIPKLTLNIFIFINLTLFRFRSFFIIFGFLFKIIISLQEFRNVMNSIDGFFLPCFLLILIVFFIIKSIQLVLIFIKGLHQFLFIKAIKQFLLIKVTLAILEWNYFLGISGTF